MKNNNPFVPGQEIKAEPIEALRKAVARSEIKVSAPLQMHDGPGGKIIRLVLPDTAISCLVTTEIQPISGMVAGQGKGTILDFNSVTATFSVSDFTEIVIFNETDSIIFTSSIVGVVKKYGEWFHDVTSCSNGTGG